MYASLSEIDERLRPLLENLLEFRRAVIAVGLLLAVVVLFRVPPASLPGIDAACDANIAGDLASGPVTTWADVRW